MIPQKTIAIKIDVDTRRGMEVGVPALLKLLQELQIPATFFLSFGPDRSGTAIWNVFKQKGFLKKMLRTNALKMYGWRTVLSGTILPAKPIAADYPDLVKQIEKEGHEVGVHAWDHRLWQDKLDQLGEEKTREQMRNACEAFKKILGRPTRSIAAPAWRINHIALEMEDSLQLLYASDSRGSMPFYPKLEGKTFRTPQFPTTIPCIEEIVADGESRNDTILKILLDALREKELNVFPAHAEVEGTLYQDLMKQFVREAQSRGYEFLTLESLVKKTTELFTRELRFVSLPGRASLVAAPAP